MQETIQIELSRYEELIKAEQKAEQYKKFLTENTNNNQLTKALMIIEGKSLYQLLTENKNKEEK